jgi:hypothetical protein
MVVKSFTVFCEYLSEGKLMKDYLRVYMVEKRKGRKRGGGGKVGGRGR